MRRVGIVGAGAVGAACAMALGLRRSADEVVLVNRTQARSVGIATDITYGAAMGDVTAVRSGDIADLTGCSVVLLTAGVNEKAGGATDRSDKEGRLKLLTANAKIYRELVPAIVAAAQDAVIIVVTDPPDPLTDIARTAAGHERVFGTGTFLDSLRFRTHLARHFGVAPTAVDALVLGEHGTSSAFLWSSARIGGSPVEALLDRPAETKEQIERDVRQANITIIEGIGASQYGIGIVSARIAEAVLRDEKVMLPVSSPQKAFGVSLSLPSVIGAAGVERVLTPQMSQQEEAALHASARRIADASTRLKQ
ncbi:lactate dehydrogenase [Bradyrhizobium sp. Leo121]|uniref:lactate/malate family dehydrogenase n=1 Tax=Bradyrhizobium sp. Leo121 TaxID=1571195 RepID=UPI001029CAB0|nr:lactate dehydrogenase [Bradyrhizobium sp. Leo121]RZN35171.1 lactate dehydrogenase [Bradyrhizobium sp. Leo121]